MRIAISCRSLEYPSGGVREYLVNLLGELLRLDTRNTYLLFHSRREHLGAFPKAQEISLECSNRLIFDWVKLPLALRKHKADVAFFPSSNMPPNLPCRSVAAMLDLGYFHPELRMYKLSDTLYMKPAMAWTARLADRLTAISGHTRDDLVRILGVPREKITVTHLAADAVYHQPVSPEAVEALRTRHGLARPFFLYTGNISPRKNLEALLEAFARAKGCADTELVVTGGMAWSQSWSGWVDSLGLGRRVRRLGHVDREEMPALYAASLAFVFPSLFEGFGLPVLEAQAVGAPVICSNATSLPEVAGDSALMLDPRDIDGWARALEAVAANAQLRADLARKGRENVKRFSWRDTALATLQVIEAAARG